MKFKLKVTHSITTSTWNSSEYDDGTEEGRGVLSYVKNWGTTEKPFYMDMNSASGAYVETVYFPPSLVKESTIALIKEKET